MKPVSVIGVAIIIAVWFIVHKLSLISTILLPSPNAVAVKIMEFFSERESMMDLWATLTRVLIGFAGTIIVGVPIGILLGYFTKVRKAFELPVDFFRSVPVPILIPLFMLLFGIGEISNMVLIVFGASLITMVHTSYGVRNCDEIKIKVAKSFGLGRRPILFKVILREALPEIAGGLRISLSIVLIMVIVLEMFTGSRLGLGSRVYDNQLLFKISEMYAVIVITGLLGYALNRIFVVLENKIVHWAGK